ncbi:hypothetical protein ACFQVC_17270 [Streptomyces monticola]|uniref:Uncharacterized protein n=1 Tax=Streptomyces monticola TaxID=2666263 RepID=A0ABW2JKE0_9ACTN
MATAPHAGAIGCAPTATTAGAAALRGTTGRGTAAVGLLLT